MGNGGAMRAAPDCARRYWQLADDAGRREITVRGHARADTARQRKSRNVYRGRVPGDGKVDAAAPPCMREWAHVADSR